MMIFNLLLYSSLTVCAAGIFYRLFVWQKAAGGGFNFIRFGFSSLFGSKVLNLLKASIIDAFLQGRILRTSLARWVMHILIFFGFTGLLFMHGLDSLVTERLFSSYYSTVNPFFFLRSLFGFMVLAGIAIAIFRRTVLRSSRLKNSFADYNILIIILMIILSGILLEGMKMTSISEFTNMVEEYSDLDNDDPEVKELEAYWVKEFALVSNETALSDDEQALESGKEVHESYCMDCHSSNKSAFLGYGAAKLMSPMALILDKINGVSIFYYFHILSCFLGLALLPFTKLFHIIATPVSLVLNSIPSDPIIEEPPPYHHAMQIVALDACTHCSTCNLNCSAGMMFESFKNNYILPSEKIQALKKMRLGKKMNSSELAALYQGLYLCTSCDRCTVVCPSGIQLKSIWINARETMFKQKGYAPYVLSVFSFIHGLKSFHVREGENEKAVSGAMKRFTSSFDGHLSIDIDFLAPRFENIPDFLLPGTFSNCFGCQNCSTICPVVASFNTPQEELNLLPHQIMYSLGLGLFDEAVKASMLWNCLSCYLCQENCPQNVYICDIIFALKNKTFNPIQGNIEQ